jgi:hypothetical protein
VIDSASQKVGQMQRKIFHALSLAVFFTAVTAAAQNAPTATVKIDGIPGPLAWRNQPAGFQIDHGSKLTILAGPKTDWYVDPFDSSVAARSPVLTFDPGDNFVLSAKVKVDFRSLFDAGALMLYADDRHWAKFAFEYAYDKKPRLVSVVTRGVSDDCTSIELPGDTAYLQIARLGQAFIFYTSNDGANWSIQRIFRLDAPGKVLAGFEAQSPMGDGSKTVFSEIHYAAKKIPNPFTGSFSTN